MNFERLTERFKEKKRRSTAEESLQTHLEAAISWLAAAQDSNDDGGVSHSYLIGERWMRSYPETTGYIIPTLLNWSRSTKDPESERRALAMADWELDVQLDTGAIPDLRDGQPVVFDTGQVLFGWVAAHRHTEEARYLEAARRGADWLLSELEDDGVWRSAHDAGGPGRVYNARVAWAMLELADVTKDERFVTAARRFLEWTLSQERGEGWYDRNCLTTDEAPLLHTIAYTARGQLESGLLLKDDRFVAAARVTATQLLAKVESDGYLPGRFRSDWTPAVKWACLTGMAQSSIVWRRLANLTNGDEAERFVRASKLVNSFLMRTQDRSSTNPGLRGGIRGSFPASGAYGRWRVLNWATKFFVDALLWDLPGRDAPYRG